MQLDVLLPSGIFSTNQGVTRIVAETRDGSVGFLPRRMDCVAAVVPGILTYQCEGQAEVYVAIDEGVLLKTGQEVRVCVRNAIAGTDLGQLRAAVEREFRQLDAEEQSVRSAEAAIESDFFSRLRKLARD
jgi:F-type H+-transporting ATPase subunit epsilon